MSCTGRVAGLKKDSSSGTYLSPQKSPKAAIAVPGETTEFEEALQPVRRLGLAKNMVY